MRLLIAEDTRDLNRALQAILENNGYEVCCAFDGEEALERLLAESFDGVILDIMMPRKDGIEVLGELRSRGVTTPVLLLTAKAEVDDRVAGLDAGADDYLPKPFAMRELLARVRALCKRRDAFGDDVLTLGDVTLSPSSSELSAENAVRLSVKEFELMQLLVKNADRPLTHSFVLSTVWGDDPDATNETLALYLSYLRAKLSSVGSSLRVVEGEDQTVRLVS
nr:response regulator transcription factor [Olsenella massiliensis]